MIDLIKFAVPTGSLQRPTIQLLRKAGFSLSDGNSRLPDLGTSNGFKFELAERRHLAAAVQKCKFDCGISGSDHISELGNTASEVIDIQCLPYAKNGNVETRWVIASTADTKKMWEEQEECAGGNLREFVSTFKCPKNHFYEGRYVGSELPNLAKLCLDLYGVFYNKKIVRLDGKEEWAIRHGHCDAIFVVTETGKSLEKNNLVVIHDNLFFSAPRLICQPNLHFRSPEKWVLILELGKKLDLVLKSERMD